MSTKNQGEGNKKAARNYNEANQNFVEEHDIETLAREAGDVSESEKKAQKQARAKAKARAKDTQDNS